jgi:hypothetical protein
MHTHGTSHLDIRLSKDDQQKMLEDGKAEPHRFAPQAGWVTFRIRSEGDVEAAKELVRLAYDNAEKMMWQLTRLGGRKRAARSHSRSLSAGLEGELSHQAV